MTTAMTDCIIDLDRGAVLLASSPAPIGDELLLSDLGATGTDGMVLVSSDRLMLLELVIFAGLDPETDVTQVDDSLGLFRLLNGSDSPPSLVVVEAAQHDDVYAVLRRLGLHHVDVIAM